MISNVKNLGVKVTRISPTEKGIMITGYKITEEKSKTIFISVFLTMELAAAVSIDIDDTVLVTGQLDYTINRYNNVNTPKYIVWAESIEKVDESVEMTDDFITTIDYITVGLIIDTVKHSTNGSMYKCFMNSARVNDKPLDIIVQTSATTNITGDKSENVAIIEGKFVCKENFVGQLILMIVADKMTYLNPFGF